MGEDGSGEQDGDVEGVEQSVVPRSQRILLDSPDRLPPEGPPLLHRHPHRLPL